MKLKLYFLVPALFFSNQLSAIQESYTCFRTSFTPDYLSDTCQKFLGQNTTPPYETKVEICKAGKSWEYFITTESPNHHTLICWHQSKSHKSKAHNKPEDDEGTTLFSVTITDDPSRSETGLQGSSGGGYYGDDSGSDDDPRKRKRRGGFNPPYILGISSSGFEVAADLAIDLNLPLQELPSDSLAFFQLAEMSDNSQQLIVIVGNEHRLYQRASSFSNFQLVDTVHIYTLPALSGFNTSKDQQPDSKEISLDALSQALAATLFFTNGEFPPMNQAPIGKGQGQTKNRGSENTDERSASASQQPPYNPFFSGSHYGNNDNDDSPPPYTPDLRCPHCAYVATNQYELDMHIPTHGATSHFNPGSLPNTTPLRVSLEDFLGMPATVQPVVESRIVTQSERDATISAEDIRVANKLKSFIQETLQGAPSGLNWTPLTEYIEPLVPSEHSLRFRQEFFDLLVKAASPRDVFDQLIELLYKMNGHHTTRENTVVNLAYSFEKLKNASFDKTPLTEVAEKISTQVALLRSQGKIASDGAFAVAGLSVLEVTLAITSFSEFFFQEQPGLMPDNPNNFEFLQSIFNALKRNSFLPPSISDKQQFYDWLADIFPINRQQAVFLSPISELYRLTANSDIITPPLFLAGIMLIGADHTKRPIMAALEKYHKQHQQSLSTDQTGTVAVALGHAATLWLYLIGDVPGTPPASPYQTVQSLIKAPTTQQAWIDAACKLSIEGSLNSNVDDSKLESVLSDVRRTAPRTHSELLQQLKIKYGPETQFSQKLKYSDTYGKRYHQVIQALTSHKLQKEAEEIASKAMGKKWKDLTTKKLTDLVQAVQGILPELVNDLISTGIITSSNRESYSNMYQDSYTRASRLVSFLTLLGSFFNKKHYDQIKTALLKHTTTKGLMEDIHKEMRLPE